MQCVLCRGDVPIGAGTMLTAGRKQLGVAHPTCAQVAQSGVAVFGKLALLAGGKILEARAPRVALAFRGITKMVRAANMAREQSVPETRFR